VLLHKTDLADGGIEAWDGCVVTTPLKTVQSGVEQRAANLMSAAGSYIAYADRSATNVQVDRPEVLGGQTRVGRTRAEP
jgi:uncharacterized membrane protein